MTEVKLDFKDVLIKPQLSYINSRKDVNLIRNFEEFKYSANDITAIPVIAANMDTVGTMDVFKTLHKHKIITFFHKFITKEELIENKELLEANSDLFALTIGKSQSELDRLLEMSTEIDFKIICIDIANGYLESFVDFCSEVRDYFPDQIIIAGNVVCPAMTRRLIVEANVDVVKVGIGGGSACTTRIKTGVGMPQLSAVQECAEAAHELDAHVISDGGITCPGDVAKAFGAGADFVMIGGYGMSSGHAMHKNYNGVNRYRTSEGRCLRIKYRGDLNETVMDYLGGLRSTCTYVDCENLEDIQDCVDFVRVSQQFNSSLI